MTSSLTASAASWTSVTAGAGVDRRVDGVVEVRPVATETGATLGAAHEVGLIQSVALHPGSGTPAGEVRVGEAGQLLHPGDGGGSGSQGNGVEAKIMHICWGHRGSTPRAVSGLVGHRSQHLILFRDAANSSAVGVLKRTSQLSALDFGPHTISEAGQRGASF